jgi:thiol:disulfide interchange protein
MRLQTSLPRHSAAAALALLSIVAFATLSPAIAQAPAAPGPAPVPFVKKHIYNETGDPKADIAAALVKAKHEHKRVILDFGGDWCGDCQVLDIYFHQAPNDELLAKHFILVHVWVGHIDTNLDIMKKYGVSSQKGGVPGLAVLAPDGSVVFAQQSGEFDRMRHMESSSVTEFLTKWKS